MSCDRYRDSIADAAAGAEAAPELGAHLERCEACRRELAARREALALADAELEGLLASTPSADLSARIRRAVAAEGRPAWWSRRVRPALAVAAALAVALGAAAVWWGVSRPLVPEASSLTRLEAPPPEPGHREHRPSPALPSRGPTTKTDSAAEAPGWRPPSEPLPVPAGVPGPESVPVPSVAPRGPEVLVPSGQEQALLRFAAELQDRTVTPGSLLVAERSAPLNEPLPLHRVEIERLTPDSTDVSGS